MRVQWVLTGVLLSGLVAGLGAGCKPGSNSSALAMGNTVSCDPDDYHAKLDDIPRLTEVEKCSVFAGYLTASLFSAPPPNPGARGEMMGSLGGTVDAAESAGPSGYSRTNIETAGADEPDMMKTDGKFIYTVSGERLVIAKSWPPTALSIVSTTVVEDAPHALLLHGNRLAVFSTFRFDGQEGFGLLSLSEDPVPHEFAPRTRITIFDVSDRERPVVERTLDLEVWYVDARLINGRLLVVGESSLPIPNLGIKDKYHTDLRSGIGGTISPMHEERPITKDVIAAAVAKTKYEDWIPSMRDSLADAPVLTVTSFDSLYMPTVTGETGMLAIVSLDLGEANAAVDSKGVIARGGRIYATTKSLFASYGYNDLRSGGLSGTSIQKFSLDKDGIPEYVGGGFVAGWIRNAFQMSEYKGYLRVAVSDRVTNHLFILGPTEGGNLEQVGAVNNFAKGESIFSSRFIGDKAFVSTYHFVLMEDPFFTFDLRDPQKPKLMGELEMPGYTSYLHPLSEDYILGIGMFAAGMGEPVTTVQIQIFDVSNFAAPVTAFQHVITVGDGSLGSRSFSEVQQNHHAFTYYAPEKLLAFPVSSWNGSWAGSFNGLMAFRVDPVAGIAELGRIDHQGFSNSSWGGSDVRRSIVMTGDDDDTYLYSLSASALLVNDIADFSTILGKASLPDVVFVGIEGPGSPR